MRDSRRRWAAHFDVRGLRQVLVRDVALGRGVEAARAADARVNVTTGVQTRVARSDVLALTSAAGRVVPGATDALPGLGVLLVGGPLAEEPPEVPVAGPSLGI